MNVDAPSSVDDVQRKRTRRKNAKSRRGCSQCKSRRVKCDEVRPSCGNCLKLGRQCPGFQQTLRWSDRHERSQVSPVQDPPRGQATTVEQIHQATDPTETSHVLDKEDHFNSTIGINSDAENWLLSIPTTWQATTLDSGCQVNYHITEDINNSFRVSVGCKSQLEPAAIPDPLTFQTPTHLPTTLIEYWFRHVCPMWSTFDSEVNWNRRLPRGTWTTSKAVFYTMQAMSASYLIDHMPQLNKMLTSMRAQATDAISQGILEARNRSQSPRVAADLVFAVFALGTSLHWTSSTTPEHPWLEYARELLSIWKLELSKLDELLHDYFCQALTYWEMIVGVGSDGITPDTLNKKRRKYQARLRQAMRLPNEALNSDAEESSLWGPNQNLFGTRPNSWCGVSREVIDLFGQALALCRDARDHDRNSSVLTVSMTSNALCDISLAHELKRELLAMDFHTPILMEEERGFPVQTRDEDTPISHLIQTAEAYRQAAILQLHLTFSDLEIDEQGTKSGFFATQTAETAEKPSVDSRIRSERILVIALQLVNTLEQIPSHSGSRCIHSMLYLSAAAGLRHEAWRDSLGDDIVPRENQSTHCSASEGLSHQTSQFIPRSIIEVSRARGFVWKRLSGLQQGLPDKASDSTLQLVKSIWLEYDKDESDRVEKHWLDVMKDTGLGISLW